MATEQKLGLDKNAFRKLYHLIAIMKTSALQKFARDRKIKMHSEENSNSTTIQTWECQYLEAKKNPKGIFRDRESEI